jgi:hypothetical protein
LPIAVLILPSGANKLSDLVPLIPRMLSTLAALPPKAITHLPP